MREMSCPTNGRRTVARPHNRRRAIGVLVGTVSFAAISGQAVSATVAPGDTAHVQTAVASAGPCELLVEAGHGWKALSRVQAQQAVIEWSWKVPRRSRATSWTLRVVCGSERRVLRLLVRGPRRTKAGRTTRLVAGRIRVRQRGRILSMPTASEGAVGEAPNAPEARPASPQATAPPSGSSLFPLDGGACTDWAYYERPDIFDDRSSEDTNPTDWDAWTWAEHARLEGLRVDEEPEAGAIAVWPISSGSPVGHVAYVEAANGSGSAETVSFSEMNALSGEPHTLSVEGVEYPYETEADELSSLRSLGVVYIHQR